MQVQQAVKKANGFVWLVLTLSLSVTIGHHCPSSLQHVMAAVQKTDLIKSFPKDYKVNVHVISSDLNATACAYTVLALLKGDWQALRKNLWEGQSNRRTIDWILIGLNDLNLTEKNVSCVWQEPVSKLITVTLQALDLLKSSHCTPCNNWAHRWCPRVRAVTGDDVHRMPLAKPFLSDDRAGTKIDVEGIRPRSTGPSRHTSGSEKVEEEHGLSRNPSMTPTSHSGNGTLCTFGHGCPSMSLKWQHICRKLSQLVKEQVRQGLQRMGQGKKGRPAAHRGRE
ncbi:uncharacterized protein LOC132380545 isoform X2 [Hypanus sabinus]|uniref:uncharacterized protein LOC132380545 isoform X2 n=1 Tax=Hypanus sabinus TaxID=79690 RepID=UPI0028C505EB|nr:uncharacterized protein LOC132380545 isoform X2 [Hypanus sabinus]